MWGTVLLWEGMQLMQYEHRWAGDDEQQEILMLKLAVFTSGFPIDFWGKAAGNIANGDHIIVGCLANGCKSKLFPQHPDHIILNSCGTNGRKSRITCSY